VTFFHLRQFLFKFVNIVGAPTQLTWMQNIKNDDDLFPLRVFFMLYCSPKVFDTTLVEMIIPVVNELRFSFDFLKNISGDDLAILLEPLGLQFIRATNMKVAIDQIDTLFNGQIPETEQELQSIKGVGQKISLLVLEHAFKKIVVSVFLNFCKNIYDFSDMSIFNIC